MVKPTGVYALRTNVAGANWMDPGPHRPDAATTAEQNNNAARYGANKIVFDSLSKEELEKRLERARKYGVANEYVDAMKSALRNYRFEKK